MTAWNESVDTPTFIPSVRAMFARDRPGMTDHPGYRTCPVLPARRLIVLVLREGSDG